MCDEQFTCVLVALRLADDELRQFLASWRRTLTLFALFQGAARMTAWSARWHGTKATRQEPHSGLGPQMAGVERFFTRRPKESGGFSGASWCHHSHGSTSLLPSVRAPSTIITAPVGGYLLASFGDRRVSLRHLVSVGVRPAAVVPPGYVQRP